MQYDIVGLRTRQRAWPRLLVQRDDPHDPRGPTSQKNKTAIVMANPMPRAMPMPMPMPRAMPILSRRGSNCECEK